jgi:pimeloyl-ACP methyl ester carboxylesterase
MLSLLLACSSYETIDPGGALVPSESVDVRFEKRFIAFEPVEPRQTGVVFYPGGLVKHEAYAPPLRALAERGYPTVIVSMPSDLAVYAPNRADEVIAQVEAERWVIAGHSLGGSMAGRYAVDGPVEGLVLWASYLAGSDDLSESGMPVLSVLGSEDGVLDRETYEERTAQLPEDFEELEIEGGNHAGFATYGAQKGDGEATITAEEQQAITVDAMHSWLETNWGGA